MKTIRILSLFCVFGAVLLRADEAPKYTPESRTITETFVTKVLKVYSFQEGENEYVSYVVDWKGHEVVVAPEGLKAGDARYKEGDEIRCMMFQSSRRVSETDRSQIRFSIATMPSLAEAARLEEVAGEVKRRREVRLAAMAGMPNLATAPRTDANTGLEIDIRANGEVVIDKVVVSEEALKEKLSAIAKENKQRAIYVVANEKASWESVTKVMNMCRKLGLQKFTLATRS